jgi:hypothetical protein
MAINIVCQTCFSVDWLVVGPLLIYELVLQMMGYFKPTVLIRMRHARLRQDWWQALDRQVKSEILAVQTLRNGLMSATLVASTAVVVLLGLLSLYLHFEQGKLHLVIHQSQGMVSDSPLLLPVTLFLLLMTVLESLMAVRHYKHLGFIASLPVGSAIRESWTLWGQSCLRRAGAAYSAALRHFVMTVPLMGALLMPAMAWVFSWAVVIFLALGDLEWRQVFSSTTRQLEK